MRATGELPFGPVVHVQGYAIDGLAVGVGDRKGGVQPDLLQQQRGRGGARYLRAAPLLVPHLDLGPELVQPQAQLLALAERSFGGPGGEISFSQREPLLQRGQLARREPLVRQVPGDGSGL